MSPIVRLRNKNPDLKIHTRFPKIVCLHVSFQSPRSLNGWDRTTDMLLAPHLPRAKSSRGLASPAHIEPLAAFSCTSGIQKCVTMAPRNMQTLKMTRMVPYLFVWSSPGDVEPNL